MEASSKAQAELSAPGLNIGTAEGKNFSVDPNVIATGRTCVIGSSGSGKSYAVAVMCEELCKNRVPFAIVDIEGEYFGLKEKYEAILVSEAETADLNWGTVDLDELARQAPEIPPLILDLSEAENPKGLASDLLERLYKNISQRRTPYLIIVEEADRFVPQAGERVPIFGEIARRGRKRGIGLMVCSQRPSLVDKNILSQCGNQLIGKLVIQNDLQSVSQFFAERGIPKQLTRLPPGRFYAMGGLSDHPVEVQIRRRETHHGGGTPKLMPRVVKPFMGTLSTSFRTTHEKEARKQQVSFCLPAKLTEQQASYRVKRQKEHIFFGEEEKVETMNLVWRPMVEVTVLQREGLLKRRFRTRYFVLDGLTGATSTVDSSLKFGRGLDSFLGLGQKHVSILRALSSDDFRSVVDLEGRLGVGRGLIRAGLKKLEDAKLVSSIETGRAKIFKRLIELPVIKLSTEKTQVDELKEDGSRMTRAILDERQVREIVKGLWEGADAVEFQTFYYPLYRFELVRRGSRRTVYLDARSGEEVTLPVPPKMHPGFGR
jgi:hypothetical protein